ncbi:hypothetical protein [Allorhizocola rhizosphaerae]|uniref:hypothetical protein n=1 Tax=Allorhizocola rhizosphaerae TaxID=1872709 RepID=UPI0013C36BDD|nr:hypothetical protein [Allorhizocola rhizosphaerae]
MAAVVTVTVSASAALAIAPDPASRMTTSCYNSNDRQRAVDVQKEGTCNAGQIELTATNSIMRWGSGTVRPMSRVGGVAVVALLQPGDRLPAGIWSVTATVLIAHSLEVKSFRCWIRTAGTKAQIGGQLQDWGGAGGWHRTMTIPGLVDLAQPDWIDIYCSHDYDMPTNGGVVQIEHVEVFAQKITV